MNELDDATIKAESLARLVSTLCAIDPKLEIARLREIQSLARQDLRFTVESILEATADHLQATTGIVKALASRAPELAIDLAMSLNVEPRRDHSLL